jgi:hypothetical protein
MRVVLAVLGVAAGLQLESDGPLRPDPTCATGKAGQVLAKGSGKAQWACCPDSCKTCFDTAAGSDKDLKWMCRPAELFDEKKAKGRMGAFPSCDKRSPPCQLGEKYAGFRADKLKRDAPKPDTKAKNAASDCADKAGEKTQKLEVKTDLKKALKDGKDGKDNKGKKYGF